jgi:hypothetical protein
MRLVSTGEEVTTNQSPRIAREIRPPTQMTTAQLVPQVTEVSGRMQWSTANSATVPMGSYTRSLTPEVPGGELVIEGTEATLTPMRHSGLLSSRDGSPTQPTGATTMVNAAVEAAYAQARAEELAEERAEEAEGPASTLPSQRFRVGSRPRFPGAAIR